MANIPEIRSKEQIAGDLIDGILARLRKDIDLNEGSVLTQLIEAISQSMFKSSADIISMLDAQSIDRAEGETLQRLANDRKVPIFPATASTGTIDITDKTFQKISTRIYSGQPAPVAGSLKIYVADASDFKTADGKIYIGRGTANVEGPLNYESVQPEAGGAYWSITLSSTSPTTKFHNIGETVILAQGGNRIIGSGTVVKTATGPSVNAVEFKTTSSATIVDGEVTVTGIPVKCSNQGEIGNVPRGAIKEAVGVPFLVSVFNNSPFTNGSAADTDDDIRARIKAYEQAKAKGTVAAIEFAASGVIAKDELKKVTSAKVVQYSDSTSALVFDDGTGYEPNFIGAPFEIVVDEAIGGETEVQLRQKPIAQARIANVVKGPYSIVDLSVLAVEVNGELALHYFRSSEFKVPSSATAFEIVSSINGNSSINFNASTADGGTSLVLYPRSKAANSIQVVSAPAGIDANAILGFPKIEALTLRLYKNDSPLFQDGVEARVSTKLKANWSTAISSGDTLKYIVDNTSELNIVFTSADFQKIDPSAIMSYTTPLEIWVQVFNNKMPGVKATISGDVVVFSSARGVSNSAALQFTGGTLLSQIFDVEADLSSVGRAPDFTLNRQTGQIGFTTPLLPGDKITAGSQYARGSVLSANFSAGPSLEGRIWMVVDGDVQPVPNNLNPNTKIKFEKTGTKLKVTGTSSLLEEEGFEAALPGDWLIVWANPIDDVALRSNQGFWRIEECGHGYIVVDDGETVRTNLGVEFIPSTSRITILRTKAPVQELNFTPNSLVDFVAQAKSQLTGITIDIVGSKVRISTASFDQDGEIYIAAMDQGGQVLSLPVGVAYKNTFSHYGFVAQTDSEVNFPSFTYGVLGEFNTSSSFSEPDYQKLGGKEDDFVEILAKYDAVKATEVAESNKNRRAFVTDFDPSLDRLYLIPPSYMDQATIPVTYTGQANRSLMQEGDRYFLRSTYSFDSNDSSVVIVDGDATVKTYTLPVARKLIVSDNSTPTNQDFSATDGQSSLELSNLGSFNGFDFADFKIHRQAQTTLSDGTYSVRVKSADFGPAGNKQRVGIVYPENVGNTSLSHTFSIEEVPTLKIKLPVSTARIPNWDYTTCFTVSKTNVDGKDILVFDYAVGQEPDFSNAGADVHVGDIVFIGNTDFLPQNRNIQARVISTTATSFTVELPKGDYVTDSLSISNIVNQNGLITVTTAVPHNISTGQRIGLYNTAISSGTFRPMDAALVATVLSPTEFKVNTPPAVPTSTIKTATHANNLVTVTTSQAHGLTVGNIVLVSGTGSSSYDGTVPVYSVTATNQFQYVKQGSSAAIANVGRIDFQSLGDSLAAAISTATKSGNTVTVSTVGAHGFGGTNIVNIQGMQFDEWSSATTYGVNDIVRYDGQNYISLAASNLNNTPNVSAESWQTTSLDLNGMYIIESVTSTEFTYKFPVSGNASATGGSATKQSPQGSLARSISGQTNENLQFAALSTTAQQIVDYINTNLSNKFVASVQNGNPTAEINKSTEDNDLGTNYIAGTINEIITQKGSRYIKLKTSSLIKKGSQITVFDFTADVRYMDTYIVINSYYDSALAANIAEVQSTVVAEESASILDLLGMANYYGSTVAHMLEDGENSVRTTDLTALGGSPMFRTKRPWVNPPDVSEEVRLVAVTSDHLNRFWNRLAVTGLSNVADIQLSKYGSQLQISTKLFGAAGSVQIAGGTSNSVSIAVVGSGQNIEDKLGVLQIPSDIKKGLVPRQWITVSNIVRQNKDVQFSDTTQAKLHLDGIEINPSLPGTFQTERVFIAGGIFADTELRIERHGDFLAFIRIAGPEAKFSSALKEGDWVRIRNVDSAPWSVNVTYAAGARVNYDGRNYTSLINGNLGNLPDTSNSYDLRQVYNIGDTVEYRGRVYTSLINTNQNNQPDLNPLQWKNCWQLQEFNKANVGIFQIVRVFGDDAFWIKNDNGIEETILVGNADNMKFYSYDSVMPGDTLVINTTLFGAAVIGRYKVLEAPFPTANRVWTEPINISSSFLTLGGEYFKINMEEKSPLTLYKRIFALGPSSDAYTAVITDTPELIGKVASSLGAGIVGAGKIGLNQDINFGIDAYKHYIGLIKELNKIIYGDEADTVTYPGVRAAGTDIDIREAIIRRVTAAFSLRVKSGVPFTEIRDRVKASVAGYVNSLQVGESVSISRMVAAANQIPGVVSVAVTFPAYSAGNDLIPVSSFEKAFIVDPTADITVSVL